MSDPCCIQVALKIRPLVEKELERNCKNILKVYKELEQVKVIGTGKSFTFNRILSPSSTHEELYSKCVSPLVDNLFSGYNVTILAYGQTGSGKTHSMGTTYDGEDEMGVIPRAIHDIFEKISEDIIHDFQICVSFTELYNEVLYDLLSGKKKEHSVLELREDNSGIIIQGVTEIPVQTGSDILKLLRKGSSNRATASTNMNDHSSRSHAIFTINLTLENKQNRNNRKTAKFNLVDLAGSERSKKTGAVGLTFKEGVNINKGLLVLGNVISALGDDSSGQSYIQYRNSNLTRLLKDSLGGNSITLMIACVSPADYNLDETLSTLRYADRAKKIKNKPIVNQDLKTAEIIKLKKISDKLKLELITQSITSSCNCEKETQMKKEFVELLFQLSSVISVNVCLMEKELLLQTTKKKIFDLKNEYDVIINSITDLFEQNNYESIKENLKKLQNISRCFKNIEDEEINKYEKIDKCDNAVNDPSLFITANKVPDSQFFMNETHLKFYTSRQNILRRELVKIKQKIRTKEELLFYILSNMPHVDREIEKCEDTIAKQKAEYKLKRHLSVIPTAIARHGSQSQQTKVLEDQLEILLHFQKMKETDQEKVKQLNHAIQELKNEQTKLINDMHEELLNFKEWKLTKEKDLLNEHSEKFNKNTLTEKIEAAETLSKNIQNTTELRKQNQHIPIGNETIIEQWLKNEIDHYLNLIEVQILLPLLVEEKTAQENQDNSQEFQASIMNINVHIKNFQQILLNCEDNVQWNYIKTVSDGKFSLQVMWKELGEIIKTKVLTETKLHDLYKEHAKVLQLINIKDHRIKELEQKCSIEVDNCAKEHEKYIDDLLSIFTKMDVPMKEDFEKLVRRREIEKEKIVKLELENQSLKNEILRLRQNSNYLDTQIEVHENIKSEKTVVEDKKANNQIEYVHENKTFGKIKEDKITITDNTISCIEKLPSKRTLKGGCICSTTCSSSCSCIKTSKGCSPSCNCSPEECTNTLDMLQTDENSESLSNSIKQNFFPEPDYLKNVSIDAETSSSFVPRKKPKRTKPFFELRLA